RDELARVDVEVESLEHVDLLAAALIRLAEPSRADQAVAGRAAITLCHRRSSSSSPRLGRRGPAPRRPAARTSTLHSHVLAVTQLVDPGGDDLVSVRQA